jgi:outer membrane protein OmpA-like peptidoglycan-associated protein
MKKYLLAILVSFSLFAVNAQETTTYGLPKGNSYDRWSVGVSVGLSHLLGDLLGGDSTKNRVLEQGEFQPSYGLQVHYQVSHSIGLRARGMFSKFTGRDNEYLDSVTSIPIGTYSSSNRGRLTSEKFSSPLSEGSLEMTYNFGNISFLDRNKNFHFVTTLGVGFFHYDSKVEVDSSHSRVLRRSGKESQIMIPMSLGFKYKVNKVDVGLSFDYRKTFVDNVDATVKLLSEYDDYFMINLGVNYTFGKKNKPMEWINPMEMVYNDLADMKQRVDILSGDKDKDGVSDLFDKDNSTPEGVKVYGDGTAIDSDGDGVPDSNDGDPFTAKGAKVDANGIEVDTDGDGVPDSHDLEANTKPGSLVNFQGKEIPVSTNGENGENGLNGKSAGFLPSIFFDLASATIKPIYHDRLLVIARLIKNNPTLTVHIVGNTDITGNESSNITLGKRRAEAVKKHLIAQYDIDPSKLITETKGEKEPFAKQLNTMNRRVDFSIE